MTILAIDSSGLTATVALMQDDRLLAEYTVNNKMTHSQTLLPMIDAVCNMVNLDKTSIDAVAIAAGPGSFTGLRIGSATAKGIALALNIPIVEVPTLEAMAWRFCLAEGVIAPMMDARRDQVYSGIYRFKGGKAEVVEEQTAVAVEEMIEKINVLKEPVILMGDGTDAYRSVLEEKLEVPYSFAPAHLRYQSAGAVAACAAEYYREGKTVTGAEHKPEYLRISQAERERAERLGNKAE